jgi:phosphatidylinositol glycan class V
MANATVVATAAASRVTLLLLAVVLDAVVDDYDRSATHLPAASCHAAAAAAPEGWCAGVERVAVWDSVYVLRIAQCGYEFEQSHAFFPLLPFLMRALAAALSPSSSQPPSRCLLALSGLLISNGAFVLSAVCFYSCAHPPTRPRGPREASAWPLTAPRPRAG